MDNISTMLQLCRLCLVKDNVNIPIFEEQGDISQIFQKISSCLPVKVSREDKLPQKICDGCSYKLDVVYDFRNTTVNAEKQLLTWLSESQGTVLAARQAEPEVVQHIKPSETFVKQEAIDPSDLSKEEDDVKSYMFHDKFEEQLPPENKAVENDDDEPPPKRAKRTAAVKAAIAIDDHESDEDDDDSGEPLTKVEDESDEGSEEDHTFVDIPSTSADDQPGPSGVGKDGGEAPSVSLSQKKLRKWMKKYAIQDCCIEVKDVMKDKTLKFNGYTAMLPTQPKRKYTCYQCWEKFFYAHELTRHKLIHKKEEEEKEKQLKADREKEKELKKQNEGIANFGYKCEPCNIGFETVNDVKKHLANNCKYYCGKCKRYFNTIQGFNIHILQHKINNIRPKEEKNYTCPECGNVFIDIIQLRGHTLLKHSKNPETSNASTPATKFATKQSNAKNDDKDFTCELCFDLFTNSKDFNDHMDFHKQLTNGESQNMENSSKNQVNELKFPVIESSYSLAGSLENEEFISSQTKNKKSQEQVEDKSDSESGFEIMKPNDVIPQEHYKCKKCFRMYMSMPEYNNHLKENCIIFKACIECSKQVKGNVHFFNHFSKIHKKTFICEYCFEILKDHKDVDGHKLSHFKLFKNVCKICFKIFKNYPAFNKHLNEHLKF